MKRYAGYVFWVGLEAVLFLGLPRLVLFPLAARIVGKEQFGLFVFALGVVMLIGQAPSVGLATGVIRNMAGLGLADRDRLVGTSMFLCRVAMVAVVTLGAGLGLGLWALGWLDRGIMLCLIPLFFFLGLWNLFDLQLARYRVERRFDVRVRWYGLLSALLFLMIPAAYVGGAAGMAWGYAGAFFLAYTALRFTQGDRIGQAACDSIFCPMLTSIWWHVSLASALELSSRYVYRVVLGAFHSYADVSVFFGATNIIDLFLAPVIVLGSMILSLLGGYVCLREVGRRQTRLVLWGGLFLCGMCVAAVVLLGRFVLTLLFPEFGDESWHVLRGMIPIIPCIILIVFARPFVVKFGPIKMIPLLNMLVLGAHLVPGLILIPRAATRGAVMSCNIGYPLSALLWLGVLVWTVKSETSRMPDKDNPVAA